MKRGLRASPAGRRKPGGWDVNVSEDLVSSRARRLGRFGYLSLGSTTLAQLKRSQFVRTNLTVDEERRKPDGIVFLPLGGIKAVVEIKQPKELTDKKLASEASRKPTIVGSFDTCHGGPDPFSPAPPPPHELGHDHTRGGPPPPPHAANASSGLCCALYKNRTTRPASSAVAVRPSAAWRNKSRAFSAATPLPHTGRLALPAGVFNRYLLRFLHMAMISRRNLHAANGFIPDIGKLDCGPARCPVTSTFAKELGERIGQRELGYLFLQP